VAVAGGATKGWNGTTLTITAASNSGISDSLARADSTHNIRTRITLADSSVSGRVEGGIAGEALTFGQVVYCKFSDGKLYKAKGDSVLTSPAIYIVADKAGIAQNAYGDFLTDGLIRCAGWNWSQTITTSASVRLYLSAATAGAMSTNVVTSTAHVSQILGIAKTATIVEFRPSLVEAVK
jgi:hypothetical protein